MLQIISLSLSKLLLKNIVADRESKAVAHHLKHGNKVKNLDGSDVRLLLGLSNADLHGLTLLESPFDLSNGLLSLLHLLYLIGCGHYGL